MAYVDQDRLDSDYKVSVALSRGPGTLAQTTPTHRKNKPKRDMAGGDSTNIQFLSNSIKKQKRRVQMIPVSLRCRRFHVSALLTLMFLSTVIQPTNSASFFGSSFVSLPLQDAKSSTEVVFRFRTSRAESLLFLAAGKTDYCLIMLQQGLLKVHMNLGAGETEVSSPLNLRMDDLSWHEVKLTRNNADVLLVIDGVHTSRAQLPGRFYELNIHFGVFVGGMGDFNEIFLGNQKNFRGCIENVLFNGLDVLMQAEDMSLTSPQAKVFNLEWDCSPQFDADSYEPLSFLNTDSYASFPSWIPRTGGTISFALKTISSSAMLLYNTGHVSSKDFLALEIYSGQVRCLMDQGNGITELQHTQSVNDGSWHNITLQFNAETLELVVDGVSEMKKPTRGTQKHIDLTDRLYMGGIVLKKKTRALKDGLKSGSSGLQGCIRDLLLDDRRIGFPEVLESFDVRSGCIWDFPCSRSPCPTGEVCTQDGMTGHSCACTQSSCSGVHPSPTGDFLEVIPVEVLEGGDVLITKDNLKIILDYKKLGIPEGEVFFHIIDPPEHGALNFNPTEELDVLSLESLHRSGIRYTHGGQEDTEDSFVFEISLGETGELVDILKVRQRFIMKIRILPVNDRPKLTCTVPGLKVAASSTQTLDPSMLKLADPDTRLDQIVVVVTYNDSRVGYIEHKKRLGERVTSFRLSELESDSLQYVQRGIHDNQIGLQAWDGEHYSNSVNLRIHVYKVELSLVNNTGITVSLGSSRVITSSNLSFGIENFGPDADLRMELISGPGYGKLERQRSNGKWITTRKFTQRQVEKGKVRYAHNRGNPRTDYFTFKALLNGNNVGKSFTFSVNFVNTNIQMVRNHGLQMENVIESVITESTLMYQTFPEATTDSGILFRIVKPPREGDLLLSRTRDGGNMFQTLSENSTFSQLEIMSGRLRYKLSGKPFSAVKDQFSFEVSTPKQTSNLQAFDIFYSPGDTSVDITLEGCEVEEGGRKVISNKYLEIRSLDYEGFVYNVTKTPLHGRLSILSSNKVDVLRSQTNYFTSEELSQQRLIYHHDDSESRRDSFSFLAYKTRGRRFKYSGVFHIHVILRNDQTPTRAVDKVFHVVEGGEKVLTSNDLRFIDLDMDTRPADIKFESRATPNGELVYAEDSTKRVSEFTQQDIDDGKIMFRHKGSNFGRILIWVNDGQLWVSTELKVRASKPFVKMINNTGIVVQRGESVVLSNGNLSVETNLNVGESEIVYHVMEGPHSGSLLVLDAMQKTFTQRDLRMGRVVYMNQENSSSTDFFLFSVNVRGTVYTEDTLHVQAYPESYWDGLQIGTNNSIYVEEGTSVRISEYDLRVVHGEVAARDIKYTITSGPTHGFLEIDPATYVNQEPAPEKVLHHVTSFTQSIINEGRLHYIQSTSNQTRDSFSFDVSNGITSLSGLVFHFIVVPKEIYIETRPLRVEEGASTFLTSENLNVITTFYEDKIADYLILQQPQHGYIMSPRQPNTNITVFTIKQLTANQIKYIHDGTDTVNDSLILVGRTEGVQWPDQDKTSVPTALKVLINPINDAAPEIVNNTGLRLWAGSTVNVTVSHLSATDPDTSAENITYRLSSPHCGMFIMWTRPNYPVSQFTQQDILNEMVAFKHTGCLKGGVTFSLTDGRNSGGSHEFIVTAKQLTLEEKVNKELVVFPRTDTVITEEELLIRTSASDSQNRDVVYLLSTQPTRGNLLYLGDTGRFTEVQNFTQKDIEERRIFYRHSAPFKNVKDFDSFNFEVMSDFAPYRLKSVFNIVITLSAHKTGGIEKYIKISNLVCQEGGNATLHPQNLNTSGILGFLDAGPGFSFPPVRIKFSSIPVRGKLRLRDRFARQGDSFTQADLDSGQITYAHDHSDTTEDRIGIELYLLGGFIGREDILLCRTQINITITPINDRMPFLVTKNPSMVVVRGQSKLINRDMIEVQDPDTSPRDILFSILDNGMQGRLVFSNHPSRSISAFTQEDINNERVLYIHDGASSQTQFYFSATDGRFQPQETGLSRHFRIHVIPLSLELRNQSTIQLDQGTNTAILTNQNLGADSNGDRKRIQYKVLYMPRAGQLLVQDRPTDTFFQINVDREEVVYLQTDMKHSNDSFAVEISNLDKKIPSVQFNISVEPLVKQEIPFIVSVDDTTALLPSHLDATKLAGLTNSNPVYHILSPPRMGKIKRIIRTSRTREPRSLRDREVWHFTHEDVKNGVIYFVGSKFPLTRNTTDQVGYRLEAPGVQPARGVFSFTVVQSTVTSWQPLPNVTPTELTPVNVATRNDIVIATGVVASLLLIIITAILIVKCRKEKYSSQVLRPNGHICQISSDARHRRNSHFDDVYDSRSGVMSMTKDKKMSSPRLRPDRFNGNDSLSRHQGFPTSPQGANLSDSDSWMESSRSRETSPSSSIPPSLPAFRVIPLCESESSGTHLSEPPPLAAIQPFIQPTIGTSEAGSNPSESTLVGERSSLHGQPLLRRNQYWV